MHLRYVNKLGIPKDIELTGEPISIGRSREADIPLLDDKVSRVHCGIRLSDGEFYLKDLKSRNGVFVNGQRVEDTVKLKVGDRIQVGSTVFVLESASNQEDARKALGSVQNDMADGKGYTTISRKSSKTSPRPLPKPPPRKSRRPSPPRAGRPSRSSTPPSRSPPNPRPRPRRKRKPAPARSASPSRSSPSPGFT